MIWNPSFENVINQFLIDASGTSFLYALASLFSIIQNLCQNPKRINISKILLNVLIFGIIQWTIQLFKGLQISFLWCEILFKPTIEKFLGMISAQDNKKMKWWNAMLDLSINHCDLVLILKQTIFFLKIFKSRHTLHLQLSYQLLEL